MLYDPKWEQQTKANPFSLENLIAWLEKQPADAEYEFCQWENCLLAQWLLTIDPTSRPARGRTSGFFYSALGQTIDLTRFRHIALPLDSYQRVGTFGAALERARSIPL